jgi:elongation factor G
MPDAPCPLIETAIAPRDEIARAQLREALPQLAAADADFTFGRDAESGQIVLKVMREAQLEQTLMLLRSVYEIAFDAGAPQVAYRETLSRAATVTHTHKKHIGPAYQFAKVTIAFAPLAQGSGFVFANEAGGAVPDEFMPGVERGLRAQKESGSLAGFPVIDVKATLVDGAYHEVDSNVMSFDIAARAAFRALADEGVAILLEPVMALEIAVPQDHLGGVIGDLKARHASVSATEDGVDDFAIIAAEAPLAHLFGYGRALMAMTQGSARFTMRFARYAPALAPGSPDGAFPGATGRRVA